MKMLKSLSQRLTKTFRKLSGQEKITAANIKSAIKEIQLALIESDVAYDVTQAICNQITEKALGTKIADKLSPSEALMGITHQVITGIMTSDASADIRTNNKGLTTILLVGLQAAGKTTFTAKLANRFKQHGQSVLLVSTDIYRPAAMQQLEGLATKRGVDYWQADAGTTPEGITRAAIEVANSKHSDVLIIDTAGRIPNDTSKINELQAIAKHAKPTETLLVVDAMSGQDAAVTAKLFSESVKLTGLVMTKTDAESRAGACLSCTWITKLPIKLIGNDEVDGIAEFSPENTANLILDQGDLSSLIKTMEQHANESRSNNMLAKIKQNKFDFNDFLYQINTLNSMGGISKLMSMLPGANQFEQSDIQTDEKEIGIWRAIIQSMTDQERTHPNLISIPSRAKRIKRGSGTSDAQLKSLMKKFNQIKKSLKRMSNIASKLGSLADIQKMFKQQ
ncbi:MAG: signal recognition particle protein [Legionellales bacterium]|nr:signal recognition particle protein [Legionellales bacterium]|tara:strand:+ start:699 stop:2051 length:1353 start_codon:yes stop_codon:yes gene_type:complete